MDAWFAIVRTPNGVHAHQLGADVEAGLDALKLELEVPEDHMSLPDWGVSVAPGVPHPSLVARLVDGCGQCTKLKFT